MREGEERACMFWDGDGGAGGAVHTTHEVIVAL